MWKIILIQKNPQNKKNPKKQNMQAILSLNKKKKKRKNELVSFWKVGVTS